MKALTCEMCSSTDVIKQDGLFVCQCCGTKYSVEEARKMMIEGAVEVQGAIRIDQSPQLRNCLENARKARATKDWSRASLYYQEVADLNANHLEATVYTAFCRLMHAVMVERIAQREAETSLFNRTLASTYAYFPLDQLDTLLSFSKALGKDILMMFEAPLEHNRQRGTQGGAFIKDLPRTDILFVSIAQQYYQTIKTLRDKTNRKDISLYLLQFCLDLHVTAKKIFSERMTAAANNLVLIERQLVFSKYPDVVAQYHSRKAAILADIQRYKTDLRDFPAYEELVNIRKEIDNLTRFLREKPLSSAEQNALRNQISNTRLRCSRTEERLYAQRNQRVAALQEELRSIHYLLGNY